MLQSRYLAALVEAIHDRRQQRAMVRKAAAAAFIVHERQWRAVVSLSGRITHRTQVTTWRTWYQNVRNGKLVRKGVCARGARGRYGTVPQRSCKY